MKRYLRRKEAIGAGGTGQNTPLLMMRNSTSYYRQHLTEVYTALGEHVPDALLHPIKRAPNAHGAKRRKHIWM